MTKTANVDIYNTGYAITGTVVQLMTGSLIYGVLGALSRRLVVENGRLDGETSTEHCMGLEGISIPGMAPVRCRCSYCWMRYTKKYRL